MSNDNDEPNHLLPDITAKRDLCIIYKACKLTTTSDVPACLSGAAGADNILATCRSHVGIMSSHWSAGHLVTTPQYLWYSIHRLGDGKLHTLYSRYNRPQTCSFTTLVVSTPYNIA
jgi:hypothetical protein